MRGPDDTGDDQLCFLSSPCGLYLCVSVLPFVETLHLPYILIRYLYISFISWYA